MLGAAPKPTPARLAAELATLPQKPPRGPSPNEATTVLTVTYKEAAALLGLSRSGVINLVRCGTIRELGKDGVRSQLDRADVEAEASKRSSEKFERGLLGPSRDQRKLEREHGIETEPRLMDRDARNKASVAESDRRHEELLEAQDDVKNAIEHSTQRILNETRAQTRALERIAESLDMLTTGLGVAAAVAGVAALTPDKIKDDLKEKIAAVFRRPGEEPTVSLLPNGSPAPVKQNSEADRPMLTEERSKEIAAEFDAMLDELERQKK